MVMFTRRRPHVSSDMRTMRSSRDRGFTIVEIITVIVIIAILATLVVVVYGGATQRADNSRRIAAAQQAQELLTLYAGLYHHSPLMDNNNQPISNGFCLTYDNKCTNYAGQTVTTDNTTLLSELSKVGTPPQKVDAPAVTKGTTVYSYGGLYFDSYYAPRTYNGKSAPALMMFWLNGEKQNCGLSNVVMDDPNAGGVGNIFITSTTGYTYSVDNFSDDAGVTECWVSVPISS